MDLLVAGLRGIEPYGLYQYGSLVDRKRKDIRSVAPIHDCLLICNSTFVPSEFVYKKSLVLPLVPR